MLTHMPTYRVQSVELKSPATKTKLKMEISAHLDIAPALFARSDQTENTDDIVRVWKRR